MKPSQRIYQQRDIANQKMIDNALYIARALRRGDQGDQVKRRLEQYTKWEIITNTLTTVGDIASGEEYKERKARKAEHEAALKQAKESLEKEVVEVMAKESTQDMFVLSDAWTSKMNQYLNYSNATTTVKLNTSLPPTATSGTTFTFSIPRFKVPAPVEEDVEGFV